MPDDIIPSTNPVAEVPEEVLIEDEAKPTKPQVVNQGQVLIDLESMIKSHITTLENSKGELSKLKDMLNGIFENDQTYRDHEEKAKEAAKVKSITKMELLKRPEAGDASEKIKELTQNIKDLDGALSDYLREYQRMSGQTEIEFDDGEVREIVYTARLIKKSSR